LDPATLSGLDVDDPLWYKDAVIYQLNVKPSWTERRRDR